MEGYYDELNECKGNTQKEITLKKYIYKFIYSFNYFFFI